MVVHPSHKTKFVVMFFDGSSKTFEDFDSLWTSGLLSQPVYRDFKVWCDRPGCTVGRNLSIDQIPNVCYVRDLTQLFPVNTGYRHQVSSSIVVRDEFGQVYDSWTLRDLYNPQHPVTRRIFPRLNLHNLKSQRTDCPLYHKLGFVPKYYRRPSNYNEKKQFANTTDYQLKIKVRPKRHAHNLVDSWDDIVNHRVYEKSWKCRKIRKQWMVNL